MFQVVGVHLFQVVDVHFVWDRGRAFFEVVDVHLFEVVDVPILEFVDVHCF